MTKTFPAYKQFKSSLGIKTCFMEEFRKCLEVNFRSTEKTYENFVQAAELYFGIDRDLLKSNLNSNGSALLFSDCFNEVLRPFIHTSPREYKIASAFFDEKCSDMLEFFKAYNKMDCR